jgi:hypothetical protein
LWTKGLNAKDIHKEKFPVYGWKCLPHKAVHNWVEKFSQGRSNVADEARKCRLVEMVAEATVQRVEELIRAESRMTIHSVATPLGSSHGLASIIMHDHLKLRKMCALWLRIELNDREKMNQLGLSLQNLLRYVGEGDDMLNGIVTRGKSRVHH